jgi:hypothetical protein
VPLGFDIEMIRRFYQVGRNQSNVFLLIVRDLGQVQRVLSRLAVSVGPSPLALALTDSWQRWQGP